MLKIISALKKSLLFCLQIFPPKCSSTTSSESITPVHWFVTHSFYNTIHIYSLQSDIKLNNFWTHLLIFSLPISLEVFYLVYCRRNNLQDKMCIRFLNTENLTVICVKTPHSDPVTINVRREPYSSCKLSSLY